MVVTSYQEIMVSSIGEMGLSQAIIIFIIKIAVSLIAYAMLIMSFAGVQPEWWTITPFVNETGYFIYLFIYLYINIQ